MKYTGLVYLVPVILIALFSCTDEQNPVVPYPTAPSILQDQIPYDILGSGKIAFSRIGPNGGDYYCFYVIDIDQQISWKVENNNNISSPCISPKGNKITFTQYTDLKNAFDVYVMDINGQNLKQLSSHPSQERFPTWNRSGNLIIYWNYPAVYSVKSDGRNDKIIRFDSKRSPSGRLSISEDQKIVYSNGNRIFIMNIDGSGIDSLIWTKENEILESPRFSPDGKTISYSSIKKDVNWEYEEMRIHLFDISSNDDRVIYNSKISGGEYSHPGINSSVWLSWSPDGSKLLFTKSVTHLTSYIFVINVDGSQLTQVTSLEGVTDRSISWSN